jgi:hypothetical protein
MPNLIALSMQQANIILEENDMCQGELSRTYHRELEKDGIIAQVPAAGTVIARGACIDLLVSKGARPGAFKMPDLAGLTLEDALQSIEKVSLTIGQLRSAYQKSKPRNGTGTRFRPAGDHRQPGQSADKSPTSERKIGAIVRTDSRQPFQLSTGLRIFKPPHPRQPQQRRIYK